MHDINIIIAIASYSANVTYSYVLQGYTGGRDNIPPPSPSPNPEESARDTPVDVIIYHLLLHHQIQKRVLGIYRWT